MADIKISELPETTTPTAADVLPVVSAGDTKKATVANTVKAGLPAQTGNSGKVLKTDGSAAAWGTLTKADVGLGSVDNTSDANKPVSAAQAAALATKVALSGDQTIDGVKSFSSAPVVPDAAYDSGWNGNMSPPTKNAVYDKIESLGVGGGSPGGADGEIQRNAAGAFAGSWLSQSGNQIVVASGKTIKTAAGAAASPALQIGQDDLGIYRQGADVLGLAHFGANYQVLGWNYHDIQRDDGAFRLNSTVAYKRNAGGDAEIAPDTGRGVIVKDARFMGRTSSAAPPSTTELPNDKDWSFHRDTAGGKTYLVYNHAGAILKVELA
jgi:hypothetical protein